MDRLEIIIELHNLKNNTDTDRIEILGLRAKIAELAVSFEMHVSRVNDLEKKFIENEKVIGYFSGRICEEASINYRYEEIVEPSCLV